MSCSYAIFTPRLRATTIERISGLQDREAVSVLSRRPNMGEWLNTPPGASGVTLVHGGLFTLLFWILGHPVDVFESVEPLWLREWPRSCVLVLAARLSAAARGRRLFVGAYAIENLAVKNALDMGRVWPGFRHVPLVNRALRAGWGCSLRLLDGLLFGTQGAQENYATAWPSRLRNIRLGYIQEWARVCTTCFEPGARSAPATRTVLFLAEFSERKGIRDLMTAWSNSGSRASGWSLELLGYGPLTTAVEAWASVLPEVTVRIGADRAAVHRRLRSAAAVVVPSKRVPGWREQVGLPILEGIAHGCAVITTDETGIAEELRATGHFVVGAGDSAALARALDECLARSSPTKRLPDSAREDSKVEVHNRLCGWAVGARL